MKKSLVTDSAGSVYSASQSDWLLQISKEFESFCLCVLIRFEALYTLKHPAESVTSDFFIADLSLLDKVELPNSGHALIPVTLDSLLPRSSVFSSSLYTLCVTPTLGYNTSKD